MAMELSSFGDDLDGIIRPDKSNWHHASRLVVTSATCRRSIGERKRVRRGKFYDYQVHALPPGLKVFFHLIWGLDRVKETGEHFKHLQLV